PNPAARRRQRMARDFRREFHLAASSCRSARIYRRCARSARAPVARRERHLDRGLHAGKILGIETRAGEMTQDELLHELLAGVPRQGPGSTEATLRALAMVEGLPPEPRVLDIGCGSGAQTIDLARATGGSIVALDLSAELLS